VTRPAVQEAEKLLSAAASEDESTAFDEQFFTRLACAGVRQLPLTSTYLLPTLEGTAMNAQMGCFLVLISVFYLVGFGLLGYSTWSAQCSMQAASWPTAQGAITHLSVQENTDGEGTAYEVKVQYAYTVDGVAHEGSRLAFGYAASSGRKTHDEIHQKLSSAKSVTVRYDPEDSAVSCLSFGLHRSIQVHLAFSITWLAFVIGFTVIVWLMSGADVVLLENLAVQ
jgi:Protein of unknown function (DUF3592)